MLGERTAGLDAVERATADCLAAERRLGRVPAGADTDALALAVVAVLRHIALTVDTAAAADALVRRAMAALTSGFPVAASS